MRKSKQGTRIGLAALAGGLAFVGSAEAIELVVDGGFENTRASSLPVVKIGGVKNPQVGGGWSIFSTYLYSTQYTMPLTNGGLQFLRPYASGTYGVANSSATITQTVSLTASTTLTPAKIDSGGGLFTFSAWFCTYRGDNDNSDITLSFLDANNAVVGTPEVIGGYDFVTALPEADNGRFANARDWGQDLRSGTIPAGARAANLIIQSHSQSGAPDGYVDLVSLNVVDTSERTPVVTSASPADKAVSVGPVVDIAVTIQDRVTAVNTNSIRLYLDNSLVTPLIQKPDTNTTVQYAAGLLPALSRRTYSIVYSDNGSPATTKSNFFAFDVANYFTLPASTRTPLGSEDSSKPGFTVRAYQVASLTDETAVAPNIEDSIEFGEAVLAGSVGPNTADLSAAGPGGKFSVPGVVNWANSSGNPPNFPGNGPFPGIPGVAGNEDSFVHEILTYIRFPAAGYYSMGINNNNDLRLTAGNDGRLVLKFVSPTNLPIPAVAIATNITQLLFGGALPLTPLTAQVLYATPSGNPDDSCFAATNAALAGKIALLDRGTTNCSSAEIAYQAQLAGAVAVLETTPGDTGFPYRLGDDDPRVTIPVLVIAENYGAGLLKSYLTNKVPVTATIQADTNPRITEWNGPKGFGNVDVLTSFAVPSPGVYPMRLVAGHKGGSGNMAANLAWFSILPDATRLLINDTSSPGALLAFRERKAASAPPVMNLPTVSGTSVTISWTGTGALEEASSLFGPWSDSPNQQNPQTVQATGQLKVYRIRQ